MSPPIPELARIGATQAPQISATVDAQLKFDSFETTTITELPTEQAQIDMRLVQGDPLNACEKDGKIE